MLTVICTPHEFCSGDKIENEMGGAYRAYGGEYRRIQGFGGRKDQLGYPGVDGNILRWIIRK